MRIESARLKSYRSWKINESTLTAEAKARYKKLALYEQLRSEGCSEASALAAIDVSRATLYRWKRRARTYGAHGLKAQSRGPKNKRTPMWSKGLEYQVMKLRRARPHSGKKTITTRLKRQGIQVSESTVGRILSTLIKRGKIKPVAFYYGKHLGTKKRVFNTHAKRWKKGMKARHIGEMIQMDHMSVDMDMGFKVKHFQAICPITKITVSRAYTEAKSTVAADFLSQVIDELPFKVKSIQVDGGSEFRSHFEAWCASHDIDLFVLPPRSPELNGCVERCNRTLRYEFYGMYDKAPNLRALRQHLKTYMTYYNTDRPHQSLNQNTPVTYYKQMEVLKVS